MVAILSFKNRGTMPVEEFILARYSNTDLCKIQIYNNFTTLFYKYSIVNKHCINRL